MKENPNLFNKQYFYKDEFSMEDVFERIAFYKKKKNDSAFCNRIFKYLCDGWFVPATPILSNFGTDRALPISCFLNEAEDNMQSIIDKGVSEISNLMALGGGVATNWSNVREIGSKISSGGQTSGVIPFIKNQEVLAMSISQGGSLRRGNVASYLHVSHPEIEEFIEMRRPTGGDISRKILHGHHAVILDDVFMQRVITKGKYELKSPKTKEVIQEIDAFELWTKILLARMETGEPYLMFEDNANNQRGESYVKNKLYVSTSNLCNEIYLTTTLKDYNRKSRTAVCCLSSLNLEYFDSFKKDSQFFLDVLTFLDNVLTEFIVQARKLKKHSYIADAVYSAFMERSIGLGVMGLHSHLQQKNIPFDSDEAMIWNEHIFKIIGEQTNKANIKLGKTLGPNPDCKRVGLLYRFSNVTAIAPTASISLVANTSPSIEPYVSNIYVQKNKEGTSIIKNKNLLKVFSEYAEYKNDPEAIWSSIVEHQGSVQHLSFLSEEHKKIFKTAFEIDMNYVVSMASTRQKYIDQGQSINLFFLPDVQKKYFNEVHLKAWKEGLKGLYYVRSMSIGKMLSRKTTIEEKPEFQVDFKKIVEEQIEFCKMHCNKDDLSCLSCQ